MFSLCEVQQSSLWQASLARARIPLPGLPFVPAAGRQRANHLWFYHKRRVAGDLGPAGKATARAGEVGISAPTERGTLRVATEFAPNCHYSKLRFAT